MKKRSKKKFDVMAVRWLREPLLHFFLLGAVVFGLHAVLTTGAKPPPPKNQRLVEITSADIEWLRSNWNKRMWREPTSGELQNLIDSFIREEILYREAVAMGLDQHDSIVRRRLAQKMEFLFKDLAEMAQPTLVELQAYLEDHPERYRFPARVSFTHVYFSPDRRGERAESDARKVLQSLEAGGLEPSEAPLLGDRLMLQTHYSRQATEDAAREFGTAFARRLFELEVGHWDGPVASAYGLHLVFVHDRIESRLPRLEEVREKVETDLLESRRRKVNQAAYDEIRSRYEVLVENLPYKTVGRADEERS